MRILIWDNFPLKNIGGPFGYLYNIHEWLKSQPRQELVFLSDLLPVEEKKEFKIELYKRQNSPQLSLWKRIIQIIPVPIKIWRPISLLLRNITSLYVNIQTNLDVFDRNFRIGLNEIPKSIELNQFDYVHFHTVQTLMQFVSRHPNYKGKTILTTHSPCPWTYEMIDLYKPPFKKYFRKIGVMNECKAYRKASYIMLPCEGAKEPYIKDKNVKMAFEERKESFFYVPTSILDLKTEVKEEHKFSNLGIPNDAFVITYIGRHCTIKGYDILKEVAKRLLAKHHKLYVVCAGNGEIIPYMHDRWIELGFIDYANEIHAQGDLYIIANRETYFDMVTLEVLRSGKHVIMSNTGGNKYFKTLPKHETRSIDYFEINDIDNLCYKVEQQIVNKQNNPIGYSNDGKLNRQLYINYFTMDKYIDKYLDIINRLQK